MNAKLDPRDLLDRQLGRVTMYRLITIVLLVLAAIYVIFSATGVIDGLSVKDQLVTLVVLLVASYASSRHLRPDLAGPPARGVVDHHGAPAVLPLRPAARDRLPATSRGWPARLSSATRRSTCWRGAGGTSSTRQRPARSSCYVVQDIVGRESPINAIWQTAATEKLFPFVVVGAFLVLWRTRRLDIGVLFIVLAGVLIVVGSRRSTAQSFGRRVEADLQLVPGRLPRRLHAE